MKRGLLSFAALVALLTSCGTPIDDNGSDVTWREVVDGGREFRCAWVEKGQRAGLWCYEP